MYRESRRLQGALVFLICCAMTSPMLSLANAADHVLTPQGVTWTKVVSEPDLFDSGDWSRFDISAFAVDPTAHNVMYAGLKNVYQKGVVPPGLLKSTDGGRTWQGVSSLNAPDVCSILVDPDDHDHILVGARTIVYHSFDGGLTWSPSIHNVDAKGYNAGGWPYSISIAAYPDFSHLYVWTHSTPLGADTHQTYLSVDRGKSWTKTDALPVYPLFARFEGTFPEKLYCGDTGQPGYHVDDIDKIQRFNPQIIADPEYPVVYATLQGDIGDWNPAEEKDGIYLTLDDGESWHRIPQPITSKVHIYGAMRQEGRTVVYAALFRTRSAAHWIESTEDTGLETIWRLEIPDKLLKNPERWTPLVLRLQTGSRLMHASGRRASESEMDVAPLQTEGRTFVPARFVAEAMGAEVLWCQEEERVDVLMDDHVIRLWIGMSTAEVDGKEVQIDPDNPNVKPLSVPPGRTMIPLRFVAETLGAEVEWVEETREVLITSY